MTFQFMAASQAPRLAGTRSGRLFVAFWPDAAVRDRLALAAARHATAGRGVPAGDLHLTLAFLGAVSAQHQPLIVKAMRDAEPVAFDLTLDSVGHFKASRAVWLGATAPPAALLALRQRLATRLRCAGFELEDRVFRPHVTVARDAVKSPDPVPDGVLPIVWPIRRLALVRSRPGRDGSLYEVVGCYDF